MKPWGVGTDALRSESTEGRKIWDAEAANHWKARAKARETDIHATWGATRAPPWGRTAQAPPPPSAALGTAVPNRVGGSGRVLLKEGGWGGGGGGGAGTQKFVDQKQPKSIFLFVNYIFSTMKSGSEGGGGGWHVAIDLLFSSAAGGAYWPIAIRCPSLPFP